MKITNKILKISILLFLSVFFIACKKDTPQSIVVSYTEHWYKGELDAAKRYIVPDQREIIDKIAASHTAQDLKKLKENTVEVEVQNEQYVTDSTMTVRCRVLINGEPQTSHYHLLKIKNRWYVDIY